MPKAGAVKEQEREAMWPELVSRIFVRNPLPCPPGCPEMYWPYRPPLTVADVKKILGWETEKEYTRRVLEENEANRKQNPQVKRIEAVSCVFKKPTGAEAIRAGTKPFLEPLLVDLLGNKVRCWKNLSNRDFNMDRALAYAQDQLNGRWRINGESIVIGRHDSGISLQHRLIGFVLADQMRETDDRWRAIRPEPLVLETFASLGVSEDQATINSIDNTLARTMADTIKTAHLFDAWTIGDKRPVKGSNELQTFTRLLDNSEKRKCARMLAKGTELLWDRVGAGLDEFHGHRTHSESAAFRDRHPRLLECVRHIFEEDAGHSFGLLGLSAGQSAACLYLMGCADSDAERYRGGDAPLNEKNLSWERWDLACQFWVDLAKSGRKSEEKGGAEFGPLENVVIALANPFNLKPSMEADNLQKLCILAKAWGVYLTGKNPTVSQLTLKPLRDDDLIVGVDEKPAFGNVDLGPGYEEQEPTPENEMQEEANRRGITLAQLMEERRTAAHKAEIEAAQKKIDAANKAKREKARTVAGAAAAKPEKAPAVMARTVLPVHETPTHPVGERAPLVAVGKLPPAPKPVASVPVEPDNGRPPNVTVMRPADKFPARPGVPTKPKGLNRTV